MRIFARLTEIPLPCILLVTKEKETCINVQQKQVWYWIRLDLDAKKTRRPTTSGEADQETICISWAERTPMVKQRV